MGFDKEINTFLSANNIDNITYYIYMPNIKPKGIIQILHGMCDYFKRYDSFANYFTSQGYIVCGNDHLGHGNSVKSLAGLGYFAEKDGYICLVEDVYSLTKIMKEKYKILPYILLGYDMGAFILQQYITKYAENLDGALIIGTTGDDSLSKFVRKTSSRSERKKGDDFRNEKLYKTMLDAYTKKIPNAKTQFDWLSRDATVVDNYINDEKCNFVFTNSAFDDLSELLDQTYGKEWAQKVATNLPIFLLSGAEDPFGNYGKGIKKIHKLLVNSCVEDVEMKIFDGCRHDILNETNKKDIFKEILEWIEQRTKGFI